MSWLSLQLSVFPGIFYYFLLHFSYQIWSLSFLVRLSNLEALRFIRSLIWIYHTRKKSGWGGRQTILEPLLLKKQRKHFQHDTYICYEMNSLNCWGRLLLPFSPYKVTGPSIHFFPRSIFGSISEKDSIEKLPDEWRCGTFSLSFVSCPNFCIRPLLFSCSTFFGISITTHHHFPHGLVAADVTQYYQ